MGAALSGVWSTGLLQKAAKTGLKATTGAVGGIVGFSSAIADGDPSNILQNTIIGVGTGSAIGGATANLPGNVVTGVKNVGENFEKGVEEYKKNAMGEEAYNNAKFDEKFYKSAGYQNILSSSGLSSRYSETQIKQFTQMYLDNGITDAGVIKRALEANINGDEYKQISELGIENRDLNKYSSIRNSHAGLSSSEIAARMQIAKNMPDKMYEDRDLFVRYAKRFGIDESEATSLFDEIDDFA